MASTSHRSVRQASWSTLAALVVAAVAAPVHQAPVPAKSAAQAAVPAISHVAPAMAAHGGTPDIVHGFP